MSAKQTEMSIIVGGGSGLGRALASELVLAGGKVLLIGRNEEKLQSVRMSLGALHVYCRAGDMSKAAQVQAAFEYGATLGCQINRVFCCAGEPSFAPVGAIRDTDIQSAIEGNLVAAILCAQEAVRLFRRMGTYGQLIVVLSTAAQVPREKEPLYCAAKWGARGFFLSLRETLKREKIELMAVYPGGMKTPFWERDEFLKPNVDSFMEPEDVAKVILSALNHSGACVSELMIQRPT